MDKKLKSIVEELNNYVPMRDRDQFVELRASQLIASTAHLTKLINDLYDEETAEELTRRLINSIKTNDPSKFGRKIAQIRDAKKKKVSIPDEQ